MKGLVITSRGIEETASFEIRELVNADCKIEDGCVIFDFRDFRDLCLLCYKCQSADRVICLLGSFSFKDFFADLDAFISGLHFDEWVCSHKKFRIECIRQGTHDFTSVDVQVKACKMILKRLKNAKIDLKDYELTYLIYIIDGKCYFGVDFSGFELNKRAYKIFLHSNSLRGTIAYALVRESGFQKDDAVLDPFSRDGIVPIETAFYASGFPVAYYKKEKFGFLKLDLGIDYEKLFDGADRKIRKPKARIHSFDHIFKYVDCSRKNAKIAGVDKFISFSRVELEWLDIKFRKETVDRIATNPPSSKSMNIDRIYNEFFYQGKFILKKDGTIALITKIPDFVKKHAEKHSFIVAKEKSVWSGEQMLSIIVFKKKDI